MTKTQTKILNLQEIKMRIDATEDFMCSWLFSETANLLPEIDRAQFRQIIAMLANISHLVSETDNARSIQSDKISKAPADKSDQCLTA